MPRYVDGFVIPISKRKLPAYRRMAALAGKVWKDYGALAYVEAIGDDLKVPGMSTLFPAMAKVKAGETVIFSYIVYSSRAHRDRVIKKVMADPRLEGMMNEDNPPFDVSRMAYGGFQVIVDL